MAENYLSLTLDLLNADIRALSTLSDELMGRLERGNLIDPDLLSGIKMEMQQALETCSSWPALQKYGVNDRIFLHLVHSQNSILNLPWQLAFEAWPNLFLTKGYDGFTSQEHLVSSYPLPLRVLVMISAPEDNPLEHRLSYEQEEDLIVNAFGPLFANDAISIDFTDDGSLEALERKLADRPYHILHFSGHGMFKKDRGFLQLEDPLTGSQQLIDERVFADTLAKYPDTRPDLVMLSSCKTAQGSSSWGFEGIAAHLFRVGVPSVVAMAHNIMDRYATIFTSDFYTQLAGRLTVPEAFSRAVIQLKDKGLGLAANQWLIPQLYCRMPVFGIVDWSAIAAEQDEDRSSDASPNKLPPDQYFIGRRRERARAVQAVLKHQPVLLTGQGGVGKTTLAENIIGRLKLSYARLKVFEFNEKQPLSVSSLLKTVGDYITGHGWLIQEASVEDKGPLAYFQQLLASLLTGQQPYLFYLDNLESFQAGKAGSRFDEKHQTLADLLAYLCQQDQIMVLMTARYELSSEQFPGLATISLNEARFNEVFLKSRQLNFGALEGRLYKISYPGDKKITFRQIITILYRTLGGNYRALEFFNELYLLRKTEILSVCRDLEELQDRLGDMSGDTILMMGRNMVFSELLKELESFERLVLRVLAGFQTPVLPKALQLQLAAGPLMPALARLQAMTLIEKYRRYKPDGEAYELFYVTPIVRELLLASEGKFEAFDHQLAGQYYEEVIEFADNPSDIEAAFEHYLVLPDLEKINLIGTALCGINYEEQMMEKAWHYGRKTRDLLGDETHANTLNYMAFIHVLRGEYDEAVSNLKIVLNRHRQDGEREGEGRTLNNIADYYLNKGDFRQAIDAAGQALDVMNAIGDEEGRASAYTVLGLSHNQLGNYTEAVAYLEKALAILEKFDALKAASSVMNNLSQVYISLGEFDRAYHYAQRALEIQEQIGDEMGKSKTFNNLGVLFGHVHDFDQAFHFLNRALHIMRSLGAKKDEGGCLNNLQNLFFVKGEYATALRYAEHAYRIFEALELPYEQATALNNVAAIKMKMGDLQQARLDLETCLEIRQKIADQAGQVITTYNLAFIHLQIGNEAGFRVMAETAYHKALQIGHLLYLFAIGQDLAYFYYDKGQASRSLEILLQLKAIGQTANHPDLENVERMIATVQS